MESNKTNTKITKLGDKNYRVFKNKDEIYTRVRELADQIVNDFPDPDNPPVFIFNLSGAEWVGGVLCRILDNEKNFPHEVDHMILRSFHDNKRADFPLMILKPDKPLKGKHLIWVDDVCDFGKTAHTAKEFFKGQTKDKPASVSLFFLCRRAEDPNEKDQVPRFPIEYIAFDNVPPGFLVGAGMDYSNMYRNLSEILIEII